MGAAVALVGLMRLHGFPAPAHPWVFPIYDVQVQDSLYGSFPQENDPFHFLPCTNASRPPPLDVLGWDNIFIHLHMFAFTRFYKGLQ